MYVRLAVRACAFVSPDTLYMRGGGMSLDVCLTTSRGACVYDGNITHNLTGMADAAGIYKHLWRPEELGITRAGDLIEPLKAGLARLQADPETYRTHDSPNGWGKYEHLVRFVSDYLAACVENPYAEVTVSR